MQVQFHYFCVDKQNDDDDKIMQHFTNLSYNPAATASFCLAGSDVKAPLAQALPVSLVLQRELTLTITPHAWEPFAVTLVRTSGAGEPEVGCLLPCRQSARGRGGEGVKGGLVGLVFWGSPPRPTHALGGYTRGMIEISTGAHHISDTFVKHCAGCNFKTSPVAFITRRAAGLEEDDQGDDPGGPLPYIQR